MLWPEDDCGSSSSIKLNTPNISWCWQCFRTFQNMSFSHTPPPSPLGQIGVSWESGHGSFACWDLWSKDEKRESEGAEGIISCLISGKVWSGKMLFRYSSNCSLSFPPRFLPSTSTCHASRSILAGEGNKKYIFDNYFHSTWLRTSLMSDTNSAGLL